MLLGTALLLLTAANVAAPAANDILCEFERLYNGICLPRRWPPTINLTRAVRTPPYLVSPPPVIEIDVGRQLLVDDFLVDKQASTGELQRHWGTPVWHPANPVLSPTEAWERGWARARPGGLWWEPELKLFRIWYQCGWACSATNPGSVGDCNMLCIATSPDGVNWSKPRLPHGPRPGTNIVLARPLDTATVWRDEDAASPSERYKLAIVPTNGTASELPAGHGHYSLYSSIDGVSWVLRVNESGVTEDGDSIWYNPFRKRFVFSIKAPSYYDKKFYKGKSFVH